MDTLHMKQYIAKLSYCTVKNYFVNTVRLRLNQRNNTTGLMYPESTTHLNAKTGKDSALNAIGNLTEEYTLIEESPVIIQVVTRISVGIKAVVSGWYLSKLMESIKILDVLKNSPMLLRKETRF